MTQRAVAGKLGVSERQVRKLVRRMKQDGDGVVVHGLRGRAPHQPCVHRKLFVGSSARDIAICEGSAKAGRNTLARARQPACGNIRYAAILMACRKLGKTRIAEWKRRFGTALPASRYDPASVCLAGARRFENDLGEMPSPLKAKTFLDGLGFAPTLRKSLNGMSERNRKKLWHILGLGGLT